MSVLSLALFGCFDSSSEKAAPAAVDPAPATPTPTPPPVIIGNAADGLVYYNNNCSVCHAAGTADGSSAFSASDLKANGPNSKLIVSNMADYEKTHNLMTKFDNVPVQRVADLNSYLNR